MVVVYKIDRLSRSLFDFAKIVELFEKHEVSFVSVTQSFNTSTSMGKLMLKKYTMKDASKLIGLPVPELIAELENLIKEL